MRKTGPKIELAFSVEEQELNTDDVSSGDNKYSQSSQGARAAAAKGYTRLTELLYAAHVQALMDGYQQHHQTSQR